MRCRSGRSRGASQVRTQQPVAATARRHKHVHVHHHTCPARAIGHTLTCPPARPPAILAASHGELMPALRAFVTVPLGAAPSAALLEQHGWACKAVAGLEARLQAPPDAEAAKASIIALRTFVETEMDQVAGSGGPSGWYTAVRWKAGDEGWQGCSRMPLVSARRWACPNTTAVGYKLTRVSARAPIHALQSMPPELHNLMSVFQRAVMFLSYPPYYAAAGRAPPGERPVAAGLTHPGSRERWLFSADFSVKVGGPLASFFAAACLHPLPPCPCLVRPVAWPLPLLLARLHAVPRSRPPHPLPPAHPPSNLQFFKAAQQNGSRSCSLLAEGLQRLTPPLVHVKHLGNVEACAVPLSLQITDFAYQNHGTAPHSRRLPDGRSVRMSGREPDWHMARQQHAKMLGAIDEDSAMSSFIGILLESVSRAGRGVGLAGARGGTRSASQTCQLLLLQWAHFLPSPACCSAINSARLDALAPSTHLVQGRHGRDFWEHRCDTLDVTPVARACSMAVLQAAGLDEAACAEPWLGLRGGAMRVWRAGSSLGRLVLTPTHPCVGQAQHLGDAFVPGQLQALACVVAAVLPGCFPTAAQMPLLQTGALQRRSPYRMDASRRLIRCCACEFLLSLAAVEEGVEPPGRILCTVGGWAWMVAAASVGG